MRQHVYVVIGGRVVELRKPMARPRKVRKSTNPRPFHVMEAGKPSVQFEATTRASAARFITAFQPYAAGKLRIVDLHRSAGLVDVAIRKRAPSAPGPLPGDAAADEQQAAAHLRAARAELARCEKRPLTTAARAKRARAEANVDAAREGLAAAKRNAARGRGASAVVESFVGTVRATPGAPEQFLSARSLQEAIRELDRLAPSASHRQINSDHTSDGHYWGPGKGRRVAVSRNGEAWIITDGD